MPATNNEIEKRLWDAADELRANYRLKSYEYSVPVLGLIFCGTRTHKFGAPEKELAGGGTRRREMGKLDCGRPACAICQHKRAMKRDRLGL